MSVIAMRRIITLYSLSLSKLNDTVADVCPDCNPILRTLKHIMEDYKVLDHIRQQLNIQLIQYLWESSI